MTSNEESMLTIAARLLRHHAADAHDEDVQDISRWLAVYDSRTRGGSQS